MARGEVRLQAETRTGMKMRDAPVRSRVNDDDMDIDAFTNGILEQRG